MATAEAQAVPFAPLVLLAYIRNCADALALRDWTLDIRWDERPDDPAAIAACTPVEGRRYAIFQFAPEFYRLSPEEMRHVVAHELVHPHFAALCDKIRRAVHPWMPDERTFEMFWQTAVLDLEPAVDALACVIAPSLPLIDA